MRDLEKFKLTGCMCDSKRTGLPGKSVDCGGKKKFFRSFNKSTSREFPVSQTTVGRILRKSLPINRRCV